MTELLTLSQAYDQHKELSRVKTCMENKLRSIKGLPPIGMDGYLRMDAYSITQWVSMSKELTELLSDIQAEILKLSSSEVRETYQSNQESLEAFQKFISESSVEE